jgi:hypothetical protein
MAEMQPLARMVEGLGTGEILMMYQRSASPDRPMHPDWHSGRGTPRQALLST